MKKFLTTFLTIGLVIAMPVLAIAATFTPLNQSVPIEWTSFKNEVDDTTSPEIPHLEDSNDVFWHFIANQLTDEQSPILKATITFKDLEGKEHTKVLNSYKILNKMNHYGIYTPFDYVLVGASVDAGIAGQFNLSHVATTPTTTQQTTSGQTTTPTPTPIPTPSPTPIPTPEPTPTPTTVVATETTEETTKQTEETTTTEETTKQTEETTTTEESETTTSVDITTTTLEETTTPVTTTTADEEIPKTGEDFFPSIVIGIVLLSLSGVLTLFTRKLKKE